MELRTIIGSRIVGASIEAADQEIKKQREKCDTSKEKIWDFGCYYSQPWQLSQAQSTRAEYAKRKKALEEADELVKKGKLDKAREVLQEHPVYQSKVPIGPSVP